MSFSTIHRLTHASVVEVQVGPLVEGAAYQRLRGVGVLSVRTESD